MAFLKSSEIQALRMRALLLNEADATPGSRDVTVASIIEWLGAMQAQDVASGLWSFGVRMPGSVEADINAALERKEALRTWPMRGTVHFVPARDAKWMVQLMGVRPLAGAAKRRESLGLTDQVVELAVDTLRDALTGGKRLTRAECIGALEEAGISIASQVGYHLLWYASQLGVTCVAPHVGKDQTFVLLDEFVTDPHTPQRDEALGIMALRYVRGHGPVTVKEMARWTGLGVRDCRIGIEVAGDSLESVRTDVGPMLVAAPLLDTATSLTDATADHGSQHLALPGFDEYMLGYGDRSLMLEPAQFQAVVPGNNGVFRSTLVRDGRVVGTWKRTMRAKACVVEVAHLGSHAGRLNARDRTAFEAEFERYGAFLGKPTEVRWGHGC